MSRANQIYYCARHAPVYRGSPDIYLHTRRAGEGMKSNTCAASGFAFLLHQARACFSLRVTPRIISIAPRSSSVRVTEPSLLPPLGRVLRVGVGARVLPAAATEVGDATTTWAVGC